MKMMKRFFRRIKTIWKRAWFVAFRLKCRNLMNSIIVYGFSFAGVMMLKYLPDFKAGALERIDCNLPTLVFGALIAFACVFASDIGGDATGKQKRLKSRAARALAYGMGWYRVVEILIEG